MPFGNCYFFKAEKKKINKFLRGNETAANELTLKTWLINSYLAFIFVFIILRVDNVIAIWCVLKERKKEREKERRKERKTGEIPKDRICSDQYISDI